LTAYTKEAPSGLVTFKVPVGIGQVGCVKIADGIEGMESVGEITAGALTAEEQLAALTT
jgi:hypothetical protein